MSDWLQFSIFCCLVLYPISWIHLQHDDPDYLWCWASFNWLQQRVYVPASGTPVGSKKEEEAVELDVYNQGMFKTELCNKWQETGACPYGENCQFAHGIKELRPVIRHPRYKTEVCRMVLAGDICPYGHRCHFRHSLTEEERLMAEAPLSHWRRQLNTANKNCEFIYSSLISNP